MALNTPASRPRGAGGADDGGVAVVVPAHRVRPLRQGPDDLRDTHDPGRHADPRHPQAHAPRRLRRTTGDPPAPSASTGVACSTMRLSFVNAEIRYSSSPLTASRPA